MSWCGEVFSCGNLRGRNQGKVGYEVKCFLKRVHLWIGVERDCCEIQEAENKAEYGYTDIVGHSCFEGWSVSLAFHSLVPHTSSSVQWGAGWESSMD